MKNDNELGQVTGALGVKKVMIFDPTPDRMLGALRLKPKILRRVLPIASRFPASPNGVDCPAGPTVERMAGGVGGSLYVTSRETIDLASQ